LQRAVEQPPLFETTSVFMQRVLKIAQQAAASDVTVLITGESGTVKNVLAHAIHGWSARRNGPFVTIPCTALAEHLLESELFGHVRGAFTGALRDKRGRLEAAAGGTVFLDEVGDLAAELQAKLLRFLEERCFERVGGSNTLTIDTRIVAATNRDLEAEVAAGRFRQDLFFRLNVVALELPPLRARASDVLPLVTHLLETLAARHRRRPPTLDAEAAAALTGYAWPGNVRELVNVLERALVLSPGDVLTPSVLPDRLLVPATPPPQPGAPLSLDELERAHVQEVLRTSTTLEEAAARLGINPTTLWRKRRRWGLE
jgi:NtrC-family two-component system response regulator AlgB